MPNPSEIPTQTPSSAAEFVGNPYGENVGTEPPVAPAPTYISIKNWDESDQPREKFMAKGRASVSDAELLGILLGTGTAQESAVDLGRKLMQLAGNNLQRLAKMDWQHLKSVRGVGDAKAITIAAALELGRRLAAEAPPERIPIQTSTQAYRAIDAHLRGLKQEQFWVLLLSQSGHLLRAVQIGSGGIDGVLADPRLVFKAALLETASSLILVHNHPSGNTSPSPQDDALTLKLREAGTFLDIRVQEHLIFTDNGFYSYRDAGRW
jgi:DNA repair protein RadC